MDKLKDYECVDCKTKRYLIFPNSNETLIICSACYRIRNEIKDLSDSAVSVSVSAVSVSHLSYFN